MAKDKSKNQKQPNRHLQARVDYLHRASIYLASQQPKFTAQIARDGRPTSENSVAINPRVPQVESSEAMRNDQSKERLKGVDDRRLAPPVHGSTITLTTELPVHTARRQQDEDQQLGHQVDSLSQLHELLFRLPYHVQQVAQKAKIRLPVNVKHSICRRCHCILVVSDVSETTDSVPTCETYVTNGSRSGKKRHADVRVEECKVCAAKRFYPVGATRQAKKAHRQNGNSNRPERSDVSTGS